MDTNIFEQVDAYIRERLAPEDDALKDTITSLSQAGMPQISVSANQGKFLQVLALLCNAKKILELGTLGGYSTIWMARALPQGGKLVTLESEPKHAKVALANIARAGLADRVEPWLGRAMETLPRLASEGIGPFDPVFSDPDQV